MRCRADAVRGHCWDRLPFGVSQRQLIDGGGDKLCERIDDCDDEFRERLERYAGRFVICDRGKTNRQIGVGACRWCTRKERYKRNEPDKDARTQQVDLRVETPPPLFSIDPLGLWSLSARQSAPFLLCYQITHSPCDPLQDPVRSASLLGQFLGAPGSA